MISYSITANEFFYKYSWTLALGAALIIILAVMVLLIKNRRFKKSVPPSNLDLTFLGGKDNIVKTDLKGSRIYLELKDLSLINEVALKENGVQSIIKSEGKIILISNIAAILYTSLSE
jgi:phosphotransferase system IIB component